jgi:gliding motility-associated-like protein
MSATVSAQIITTIAGNGTAGFSGDGGVATRAKFNIPVGICFDPGGNMYVADYGNQRVRKVAVNTGIVSTVAGNGIGGFSGDGGLAINAELNHPTWLLADNHNHLYITDYLNLRVRMVDLVTGIITTVAGNGTEDYVSGGRPTEVGLLPMGLALDNNGNLFITQRPPPLVNYKSDIISKIDKTTGIITTYAGNGQFTFAGDGGPALQASFNFPYALTFDATNNLYVADYLNSRIRKIDAVTHIVTTVAGNGSTGIVEDNKPAVNVSVAGPTDVKFDKDGNLLVVGNSRVRKIDMSTGIITTIAGNGLYGKGKDCIPPTESEFADSRVVAIDPAGNICISDQGNNRVRAIIPGSQASISISPSTSNVCTDNVVTFSTQTSGAGPQAIYQWKKNGGDVGTNSPSYTDSFKLNDEVICVLTPGTCGNRQVFSNTYVLNGTEPTPAVDVKSTSTDICSGSMVTFTATNVNSNRFPLYEWMVNDTVVASGSDVFNTTALKDADRVKCKMTVPQCAGGTTKAFSTPIAIKVYSSFHPTITITVSANNICKGTSVSFKAVTTQTGSQPIYQWKINNIVVGTNNADFATTALSNGDLVTCTVTTDANNTCGPVQTIASDPITMKVQEPLNPSVQIAADKTSICQGDVVRFSAQTANAGDHPAFTWQLNGSAVANTENYASNNLSDKDAVSCLIQVTGCTTSASTSSNSITMSVNPVPVININPADTIVAAGSTVALYAQVSAPISYAWSPTDQLQSSLTLNPVTVPLLASTNYQLRVTSVAGCNAVAQASIKVITQVLMPSAFTPNADGKNDVFRIPPSVNFHLRSFSIYDRWGNKIFSTSDISKGWDGTYKGVALNGDTFIYTISGKDDKGTIEQKGTVLLIR